MISEASMWCIGVFVVLAIILGYLLTGAAKKVYYTSCPTCHYKYRWHTKARQGLRCKKCGNIFLSRYVED
uniref:Uncharacterized protein n=1 Tax=viral metagenome TaxID=1070528 RepID=A0A6H1ZI41_9ZZZZ